MPNEKKQLQEQQRRLIDLSQFDSNVSHKAQNKDAEHYAKQAPVIEKLDEDVSLPVTQCPTAYGAFNAVNSQSLVDIFSDFKNDSVVTRPDESSETHLNGVTNMPVDESSNSEHDEAMLNSMLNNLVVDYSAKNGSDDEQDDEEVEQTEDGAEQESSSTDQQIPIEALIEYEEREVQLLSEAEKAKLVAEARYEDEQLAMDNLKQIRSMTQDEKAQLADLMSQDKMGTDREENDDWSESTDPIRFEGSEIISVTTKASNDYLNISSIINKRNAAKDASPPPKSGLSLREQKNVRSEIEREARSVGKHQFDIVGRNGKTVGRSVVNSQQQPKAQRKPVERRSQSSGSTQGFRSNVVVDTSKPSLSAYSMAASFGTSLSYTTPRGMKMYEVPKKTPVRQQRVRHTDPDSPRTRPVRTSVRQVATSASLGESAIAPRDRSKATYVNGGIEVAFPMLEVVTVDKNTKSSFTFCPQQTAFSTMLRPEPNLNCLKFSEVNSFAEYSRNGIFPRSEGWGLDLSYNKYKSVISTLPCMRGASQEVKKSVMATLVKLGVTSPSMSDAAHREVVAQHWSNWQTSANDLKWSPEYVNAVLDNYSSDEYFDHAWAATTYIAMVADIHIVPNKATETGWALDHPVGSTETPLRSLSDHGVSIDYVQILVDSESNKCYQSIAIDNSIFMTPASEDGLRHEGYDVLITGEQVKDGSVPLAMILTAKDVTKDTILPINAPNYSAFGLSQYEAEAIVDCLTCRTTDINNQIGVCFALRNIMSEHSRDILADKIGELHRGYLGQCPLLALCKMQSISRRSSVTRVRDLLYNLSSIEDDDERRAAYEEHSIEPASCPLMNAELCVLTHLPTNKPTRVFGNKRVCYEATYPTFIPLESVEDDADIEKLPKAEISFENNAPVRCVLSLESVSLYTRKLASAPRDGRA